VDHGHGYLVSSLDASRTIVTCHDIILLVLAAGRIRSRSSPRLATAMLRRSVDAMKKAARIVADSENTRRDLCDVAGIDPARITVVHPGLNDGFRPQPERRSEIRERLQLPAGPIVLQVGDNGFYKNIPGCFRVTALLRRGGLDVTFVRAGRPLTREQLAIAERLGVHRALRDLGPIGAGELADLYSAADVLLFPSLYEGFGWPPLEAMASGLPVVCSRGGSLGEVVGNAALTAEPEDTERLADHVVGVLTDRSLADKLRALGAVRAAEFSWEKTASTMLGIYREVAGR
jgi:glycosyltransferase involved in cell wall biosynthesis